MTTLQIFNTYFKKKLLWLTSIGIGAFFIRYIGGHQTELELVIVFMTFLIISAIIMGLIDYTFYEKSAPKAISKLIDKLPLIDFQKIGFIKTGDNKLSGQINGYDITLTPIINIYREQYLAILIPITAKEGLDKYFEKFDGHFTFKFTGVVLFNQAVLKDYVKNFTFKEILNLIETTTEKLRALEIDSLEIVDDD